MVAVGFGITVILFTTGRFLNGPLYGSSSVRSGSGAAGALVILPFIGLLLCSDFPARRRIHPMFRAPRESHEVPQRARTSWLRPVELRSRAVGAEAPAARDCGGDVQPSVRTPAI